MRLTDDTVSEVASARCGEGFLEQILDVLIANAATVSPDGGTIRIRVEETADGPVRILVEDEGAGLEEDALERAFERFWRAPRRPRGSGSGLGLPIARRLARLAGGDVALERREPTGIRAVVTLRGA